MQTIVVANPKGGSGKTTLATNLAGFLAGKRQRVALADEDPQQSASGWLARRPALFPAVHAAPPGAGRKELRDVDPQWLIVDTPAGVHGDALKDALRRADLLFVPVTPSAFDMAATERFLDAIAQTRAVKGGLAVALVAMRVDTRTHSTAELQSFLEAREFPLVGELRSTQVYVYCARDGASVFDLPRSRAEQDWEQWRPLTRWLSRHATARAA